MIFRVRSLDTDVNISDSKIVLINHEQGTTNLMVSHIHAFTFHTTLFVMIKGILYAKGSRLVLSKYELGLSFHVMDQEEVERVIHHPSIIYILLYFGYIILSQ